MINKFKKLSFDQKRKVIFVIWAVVLLILTLAFSKKPSSFMFYLMFMIISYPTQNHYQKIRVKELNHMWTLADDFNVTEAKLSEVTGIGLIDLEATKKGEAAIYFPPRKDVQKGISYLESLPQAN